jgi:hypothetical protein
MDVARHGQPPGITWCKTCGAKCRQTGKRWRHMSATSSGAPHDHNAVPGAPKPSERTEYEGVPDDDLENLTDLATVAAFLRRKAERMTDR